MHNEGLLKGRTSWRQPPSVLEWWWGLCKGSLPLHSLCKLIPIRIITNQPVTLTITLETGGLLLSVYTLTKLEQFMGRIKYLIVSQMLVFY